MDRTSQNECDFIRFNHLNINKLSVYIIVFVLFATLSFSHEQRLTDHATIGWLTHTTTFKIKPKVAIHTEYQWRRVDGLKIGKRVYFEHG